jgi:hypothetical protein
VGPLCWTISVYVTHYFPEHLLLLKCPLFLRLRSEIQNAVSLKPVRNDWNKSIAQDWLSEVSLKPVCNDWSKRTAHNWTGFEFDARPTKNELVCLTI